MMGSVWKPSKPGTCFKAGKLYVFDSSSITVMRAWPPMAWQKTLSSHPAWCHCRPDVVIRWRDLESRIRRLEEFPADENGQLLLPFCVFPEGNTFQRSGELAWLKWSATIPKDARDHVRRYRQRQWHMLSFLSRCGEEAA